MNVIANLSIKLSFARAFIISRPPGRDRRQSKTCVSPPGDRSVSLLQKINAAPAAGVLHSIGVFVTADHAGSQPCSCAGRNTLTPQDRLITRVEVVTDTLAVTSARGL